MNKFLKRVLAAGILSLAVALLIIGLSYARRESVEEAERERPPEMPSQAQTVDGQTFITLDKASQDRNGIVVATLRQTMHQQQVSANAVVLPVQQLTELRSNYLAGAAQLEKATAALRVSRSEYDRLKMLYQDEQNASAKAMQAAEGAWRSDQANARVANEALRLNEVAAQQTWGPVISKWVIDGSPALDRILAQKDLLIQVSFSPGGETNPPKTAFIQSRSGRVQRAEFVSAYPTVDPRMQSPSFLYVTPATPEFVPGMTLVVQLPTGPQMLGIVVPANAIIWSQGKAWTYLQIAPDRFTRREVPTETPAPEGFFVATDFKPGEKVVIQGGQQFLSEEFRSQIHAVREGGEEEQEGK